MARRHELTDAQWRRIEPFLPGKAGDPGRTGEDNRRFVDATIDVLKTGVPWAGLPERYGKPNTVWKRSGSGSTAGVPRAFGKRSSSHSPRPTPTSSGRRSWPSCIWTPLA